MKIKNHKKITNLSFNFKKYYFFRKYNYMSKIFPKIYFNFEKKNAFIPLSPGFYYYVFPKQMNSNMYYITTSFIPCNTYSYSYVITVTIYQTYPS